MWAQTNDGSNPSGQIREQVPYMNTLTSCVNKVVKDGYVEQFKVTRGGLAAMSKDIVFQSGDVRVINFYRFEGQSYPGDNAILYVIETSDGTKGTLIDGYGAYSDTGTSVFMNEVEEMQKKVVKNPKGTA